MRSAYVLYVSRYISYAKRVAAETETETKVRPDETNDVQIEIEKREGREEQKKSASIITQERKQKTAPKGNTYIRILQARSARGV